MALLTRSGRKKGAADSFFRHGNEKRFDGLVNVQFYRFRAGHKFYKTIVFLFLKRHYKNARFDTLMRSGKLRYEVPWRFGDIKRLVRLPFLFSQEFMNR